MNESEFVKKLSLAGIAVESLYGMSNDFHYTMYPLGTSLSKAFKALDSIGLRDDVRLSRTNDGRWGVRFF